VCADPPFASPVFSNGTKEVDEMRSIVGHATDGPAFAAKLRTPFAVLGIRVGASAVTGVEYLPMSERAMAARSALAEKVCRQIERFLDDPHFRFTLPLSPAGTDFRRRVWDALPKIPVGESRTYGEIARQLASAPRAIGGACGANPIALIIPCHRVVGSQGSLGGFMRVTEGKPIDIKRWLLTHEGYRFGR
jgi:methylated-DNA-[protein]-cysteine S-methyltransferase